MSHLGAGANPGGEGQRFRLLCLVLAGVLGLGTLGFMGLEGMHPLDALYLTVITVATVGYGDLHPTTPAGKFLAVVLILGGVSTFLGVVATATEMLVTRRAERDRRRRVEMVVGIFFSEVGAELLRRLAAADPVLAAAPPRVRPDRAREDFDALERRLGTHEFLLDPERLDLGDLAAFLRERGELLLRLYENPNLSERGEFTELLRAVLHLREELLTRRDLSSLTPPDRQHLTFDARRVYPLLARRWIRYVEHLETAYPYLFSFAVRTNPFDREARPEVAEGP
ncbi:MAG: two pore domain potassium channel family protein [Candidatus Dadabacteria bacterium]|nr:MAG: two pore domain potassium channel family protein [Candidatus Dadabacteria bacterium]